MSVSSTTSLSSSKTSGGVIDVGGIVDGLMAVRQASLEKVKEKINKNTTTISALGMFTSKLVTLHDAVQSLETVSNFSSTRKITSSNSQVAAATDSGSAVVGTYVVNVTSLAGYDNGDPAYSGKTSFTITHVDTGTSFSTTIDGASYSKYGLNLEFNSTGVSTLRVTSNPSDQVKSSLKAFVAAYNDLVSFYQSSASRTLPADASIGVGSLAGNSTVRSIMSGLSGYYAKGNASFDGAAASIFDSMGITYLSTGQLSLNETTLDSALIAGLATEFSNGVRLGYAGAGNTLSTYLSNARYSRLTSETQTNTNTLTFLQADQVRIQSNLDILRKRYLLQYSALDVQLSKIQSIGNSFSAVLAGLQKG